MIWELNQNSVVYTHAPRLLTPTLPPGKPTNHRLSPSPTETQQDSISHEPQRDDIKDFGNFIQDGSGLNMDSDSQETMDLDDMADYPRSDWLEFWSSAGVRSFHHRTASLNGLRSHTHIGKAIVCLCVL